MKRNVVVLALAAGFALPAVAEESYTLDPVHSQPGFVVHHLGLSNQVGRFEKSTAKITLDREARTGTVDVTIDAASIRTFDPVRLDAIVKGEKYFNVEKYPTITFRSNDVRFDGDRVVAVNGELTMLGVTRPVAARGERLPLHRESLQQEGDVRRRGDRDDQALRLGHDGRDPLRPGGRGDPAHSDRGVPGRAVGRSRPALPAGARPTVHRAARAFRTGRGALRLSALPRLGPIS